MSFDPIHHVDHGKHIDFDKVGLEPADHTVEKGHEGHHRIVPDMSNVIPPVKPDVVEVPENPLDTVKKIDKQLNAVEIVENKQEQLKKAYGNFKDVMTAIKWTPDLVAEWFATPYGHISPFAKIPKDVSKEISEALNALKIARSALSGVTAIGDGMALIAQGLQYQTAKLLYQQEKEKLDADPDNLELKKVVEKLMEIIAEEKEVLKTKGMDYARSTTMTGLGITSLVLRAFESVSSIAKSSVIWAMSILGTIGGAIGLWRANKGKAPYETWMGEVAKNPQGVNQVQELLTKREESMKQLFGQEIEKLILKKVEERTFDTVKKELFITQDWFSYKNRTVIFNIKNFEGFKEALKNPEFRDEVGEYLKVDKEYAKKAAENIDTINAMTKNGLKALSEVKAKNEKRIFMFNLNKQKVEFTLSCLSTAIFLTLGVLTAAGVITLAGSTMAIPGLGFFVLGLAISGIGMYYFYKRKPNLFKCYMRCVNLRLMFYKIPSLIRNWQLAKNELGLQKISAQQEEWKGLLEQRKQVLEEEKRNAVDEKIFNLQRLHGKSLDNLIQESKDKQQAYEKSVAEARQKVDYWTGENGRITKLQNRLTEAGNKDFAIANRLVTDAENQKMDIPAILAEKIVQLQENSYLDEDTHKVLKEKMGIDLKNKNFGESVVIDRLKNFFKMDEGQFLNFIKKQLAAIEKEKANQLQQEPAR